MQENLEIMNQEVILYLLPIKKAILNYLRGRVILILPFFCFSTLVVAQQHPTNGVVISDFEYAKIEKRFYAVRGGERVLPQSHSLKAYAPKPLNQFNYPTSPAWATSYAALTIIETQQTNRTGRSITENAFSPLFPYYYSTNKDIINNCENPVSIAQVLEAMKTYGTPRYTEYPVRCVTRSPESKKTKASKNKISEYARLFDIEESEVSKIKEIKTTLVENLPVVIAMHIDKSFSYAKDFWQPREAFNINLPTQALCVVGYDDTKYGGAFEVMNSMGAEWGNDGFMWIPYKSFITYTRHAYSLYMIPPKNSINQLSGGIELEIVNGNQMELLQTKPGYYKINKSYPSGTLFKIKVINHSTGFLYVFASDLTNDIFELFPPNLTSAAFSEEASFYVPDDNTPIQIDETIGTDYLCVLFSKEDIDLPALLNTIKSTSGTFEEKVINSISDKSVPNSQIYYKLNEADFFVKESDKTIVALIIEHEHH